MERAHQLPQQILDVVDEAKVLQWIKKKATAHKRRDIKRGCFPAGADYVEMMLAAVKASGGFDHYSGEWLHWHLISTYDNDLSSMDGRRYKKAHDLLPTIDHVFVEDRMDRFVVCGWRTNDAKGDMTHEELLAFCRMVLEHQRR